VARCGKEFPATHLEHIANERSVFVAGYLGVMPILKNYLDNNHSDVSGG